jgi:hypothetical protein
MLQLASQVNVTPVIVTTSCIITSAAQPVITIVRALSHTLVTELIIFIGRCVRAWLVTFLGLKNWQLLVLLLWVVIVTR